MLQQSTKHLAHQGHILGACSGIYYNVIYIHHYTLPVQVPENLIYKGLKDLWDIHQPVRHDKVLIGPRGGTKCCLPLIPLPDTHQVVSAPEIQFCEEAHPVQ
jgi:hypothetical protein